MPHLVQMDKRYKKKGLVVIGDEVQGSAKEDIEKVLKEARAEFPVTTGSTQPATLRGIPHAVVFDPAGKLVFAGHPADEQFDRVIKKALKDVKEEDDDDGGLLGNAPKPVIESRPWTNANGVKITAAILSIGDEKVRFKLADGKEYNYEINNLSDEDQELIRKAAEEAEEEE